MWQRLPYIGIARIVLSDSNLNLPNWTSFFTIKGVIWTERGENRGFRCMETTQKK